MKVQVLSDLHNEFLQDAGVPPIADSDAELVILAGDIDVGTRGIFWAAEEAARLGKPIVYVSGNHEFYHHDTSLVGGLSDLAAGAGSVHFLENSEIVLGDVRFLGCTLWTDYRASGTPMLSMRVAQRLMNDHRLIKCGEEDFEPADAARIHAQSRAWLASRLADRFEGKTVVVTHHGPHRLCRHPNANFGPLDAAFWSDLGDLVQLADL